ncbi:MAG TPA: PBP1A family penicillin-binding protein [Syntrophorhabdaceae bacterium]|nr:PBP1A family penicillin-binding protein [Syntrophorhabdaceae bacterium]HQM80529.1 PBP1A family penicillin-binding protein [Syntrophorhabdaceae bacterium]
MVKKKAKPFKKRIHLYLIVLILLSFALLSAGFVIYIMSDIPSVEVLKLLKNKPVTNIYDNNDQLIYLIVPDNRIFVAYNKIPQYVRDAFLAAEDADFFKHGAVDPLSILRALWKNILYGKVVQGGSTITQQVVKSLMLTPEKNITRKVKEAILSYRLENSLTKKEILNLYLNNIYMGHGVYGVEAASQVYFGRHAWEISRAEAALLAGIVQAPSRYTPKKHPGNARARQEYVVDQMEEKGFINPRTKNAMLKEKIAIREDDGVFSDSYYKDFIFRYVENKYGKGAVSRKGMKIYAAVDIQSQRLGEEAVRRGLNLYEQRKGDYVISNHLDKRKWDDFKKAEDRNIRLSGLRPGKTYNLLVSERMKKGYMVYAGNEKGVLHTEDFPFKPGDVIKGTYSGVDKRKTNLFLPVRSLKVEGALLCMDVRTGYVHAMVGGRDFERSPYNRAVSAKIQSGSAFKPFIYASALKKGYDLDTYITDEPKEYNNGAGRKWIPKNYDNKYDGKITIRDAVAYSKNAATVRLLEDIGVGSVKETLRELGLDVEVEDNLSIALGTSNLTLLDLVKGFAVFANGGSRVKPVFVKRIIDNEGNVLEETPVEKERAIPDDLAAKMNALLKGPTEYGTAKGASKMGYPVAGKTGTTSNYYDALFVGYSPHIATGVWVGFDARTSLGKGESGARVCLPIWMSFMGSALRRYPPDDFAEIPMQGIDPFMYH